MYVVFNETMAKNRRNGARGGRAFARNQRLRKLLAPAPPPPPAPCQEEQPETAHEASLLLDRQFPWLAGAFAPRPRRKPAICDSYRPLDS
jgi:hypothetical protein